ncbi:MAG TPA: lipoprotein [Pseudoxanthomonas sp.]|nr:lipoprotein [Pseudoxanthomonas sp.]
MKTLSHFALIAVVVGLLAACGAKGPLFLPEKPLEAAPAEDVTPAPGEDAPDAPVQPEDEPPLEDPATPTDGNG